MALGWKPLMAIVLVLGFFGMAISATWLANMQTKVSNVGSRLYRVPGFDTVVGFSFSISVVVEVRWGDTIETNSGGADLSYKQYTITCKPSVTLSEDARTVSPILSRPSIDPRISGTTWQLWSDTVATWEGLPWNRDATVQFTTTQSDPNPDAATYADSKPSKYLTIAGFAFDYEDLYESLMQAPTVFHFNIQNKATGAIQDIKLPYIAAFPRYGDTRGVVSTEYRVDFYVGLGGRFAKATDWEVSTWETSQVFKVGYKTDYVSLYDLIPWDFPVFNYLFGTHVSTMDIFRLDTTITPICEAITAMDYLNNHGPSFTISTEAA
jgi:hypothetical protein